MTGAIFTLADVIQLLEQLKNHGQLTCGGIAVHRLTGQAGQDDRKEFGGQLKFDYVETKQCAQFCPGRRSLLTTVPHLLSITHISSR